MHGGENNLEELAKGVLWLEGLEEHNLSRDYWFELYIETYLPELLTAE